jgi:hypothetical protein
MTGLADAAEKIFVDDFGPKHADFGEPAVRSVLDLHRCRGVAALGATTQ